LNLNADPIRSLTLLHTAEVHRTTFDRLAAELAPDAALRHIVRTDWLDRAQGGIDADLRDEIQSAIRAEDGAVLCTCTTLGDAAQGAGALRIDRPMMDKAAEIGGLIGMAFCLKSTVAPSTALLRDAIAQSGKDAQIILIDLCHLWPLFENGDASGFALELAKAVGQVAAEQPKMSCVVLAQASMSGAAPLLAELSIPALSSPELALITALGPT
jgi:hypothetical protein